MFKQESYPSAFPPKWNVFSQIYQDLGKFSTKHTEKPASHYMFLPLSTHGVNRSLDFFQTLIHGSSFSVNESNDTPHIRKILPAPPSTALWSCPQDRDKASPEALCEPHMLGAQPALPPGARPQPQTHPPGARSYRTAEALPDTGDLCPRKAHVLVTTTTVHFYFKNSR